MNALSQLCGQLLSSAFVLYILIIGILLITNQNHRIKPLNDWLLKKIGQGLRALFRAICKLLEDLFRWLRSIS